MAGGEKNPKVDAYFDRAEAWCSEMEQLRAIMLGCGLTEELKWGRPGYTVDGNNVAVIQAFKNYCALLFVKGALLKDPQGILVQQTENVQAARQLRFTSGGQIAEMADTIRAYVDEAVAVEQAGLEVEFTQDAATGMPQELQSKLDGDPAMKAAFEALTPGRQRAYALYCAAPKQEKTRQARVEKCTPGILAGRGLNDPE